MSHSTSFADYRVALTTPQARLPVLASLFARLPIAMIGLSLLLYVQRETSSFASAGLVSAGALVGVSVGSVIQGRLLDRLGPSRPLLVMSGLFGAFVVAGVLAVQAHAPVPVLVALAFCIGADEPAVGSASRALWSRIVPSGPVRNAAFSYEAISMEVFFILGPGLAGLLVATPWPGWGVVVGATCMVLGAVGFALTPTVRAWRPARGAQAGRSMLGALASPGMRTVAVAALGFGVTIGYVEVAVPAAATEAGHPAVGGVLLALWSVSSVIFGVLYSTRPWPRPMHLRLPVLLGGFAAMVALLALPSTLFWLGAVLLLVGTMITPQSTSHSAAIEGVAPAGTIAEAFGWVVTAVTLGLAIGQSVSGVLVEHFGPPVAFVTASASGLVIAGVLWLLRRTLEAGPASPARPEPELAGRAC